MAVVENSTVRVKMALSRVRDYVATLLHTSEATRLRAERDEARAALAQVVAIVDRFPSEIIQNRPSEPQPQPVAPVQEDVPAEPEVQTGDPELADRAQME